MSYENRQEDSQKLMNMDIGEELYLNMFQDGGSLTVRKTADVWGLSEITLYGINEQYYGDFSKHELDELIHIVYDIFI